MFELVTKTFAVLVLPAGLDPIYPTVMKGVENMQSHAINCAVVLAHKGWNTGRKNSITC